MLNSSVFRIFRESLEYAAARSCGISWPFPEECDKEIILKAESLSGAAGDAAPDGPALVSIFNVINPAASRQYAVGDAWGLFDGYRPEGGCDRSVQYGWWKENSSSVQDADYAQSLLEMFEDCFSVVPSPLPGVSCYHWGKTLASVACCLMYNREKSLNREKPFILYSIDFSGIQSFIYTIISAGALKALKTRSLYLSILSEHISDSILSQCGLPRCNLIYVGGGRAHLLLSSDPEMLERADQVTANTNRFLKKNFGTSLYLASGWAEAGEEDLHSGDGTVGSFSELFRTTSRMISGNKLRRYDFGEIRELNRDPSDAEGRTCAICGRSSGIVSWKEKHLCRNCAELENFSVGLTDDCDALCIVEGQSRGGLPVPGPSGEECFLSAGAAPEGKIVRKYTINRSDSSSAHSVRIFMSRQHAVMPDGVTSTFADMVNASAGIRRLGVLRGDVDSLGLLFAKGFYRPEDAKPWQNSNISYYSSLSGALTWFFQRNLDRVLREKEGSPLLKAGEKELQVTVVYAGGDDVFLVGAWNDVLDAGLRIQAAFKDYTGGSVTLSGGYSFFPEKTPVPVMADTTASLEEAAKQRDGKNAIALFGTDGAAGSASDVQCYAWDEFRKAVLDDKVSAMNDLFGKLDDKGNSFLYHVLGYFRQMQGDPMAISRLAYLLARHKPSKRNGASAEMISAYDGFMKKAYKWALEPEENKAFRTACLIYVYLNREAIEK